MPWGNNLIRACHIDHAGYELWADYCLCLRIHLFADRFRLPAFTQRRRLWKAKSSKPSVILLTFSLSFNLLLFCFLFGCFVFVLFVLFFGLVLFIVDFFCFCVFVLLVCLIWEFCDHEKYRSGLIIMILYVYFSCSDKVLVQLYFYFFVNRFCL